VPVLVVVEVMSVSVVVVDQMVKSNFSLLSLLVPSLSIFEFMPESSSAPMSAVRYWSEKETGRDLLLLLPSQVAVSASALQEENTVKVSVVI